MVKHSYFSYIAVMEYQKRGVVHFHILADNWLPYSYLHEEWNTFSEHKGKRDRGYAHVLQIKGKQNFKTGGTVQGAIRYLAKYLVKDGAEPIIWMKEKYFVIPEPGAELKGDVPPVLVTTSAQEANLSSELFDKEPSTGSV